jgi:hypothetical protein
MRHGLRSVLRRFGVPLGAAQVEARAMLHAPRRRDPEKGADGLDVRA